MVFPDDEKIQARIFAIYYLQDAVWSKCEQRVRYALKDADLHLERTNLFAAGGELFVRAVRDFNKDVFTLLMDHFKKHFLYRQWLEIPQPADSEDNLEEEEEDFDDYSIALMPTPFSVMRDNFEGALHAWKLVLDESILADLKKMFDHSSSFNQTPPTDLRIGEENLHSAP